MAQYAESRANTAKTGELAVLEGRIETKTRALEAQSDESPSKAAKTRLLANMKKKAASLEAELYGEGGGRKNSTLTKNKARLKIC